MNYKNIFKRETKVIAYVVICLTLVVIGTSYALFLQVNNNTNNQIVKAGSLEITYSGGNTVEVDETATQNCLTPQSDVDGSGSGGCKFELSVRNTGTLPMQYDLLIYNNTEGLSSGTNFVDYSLVRHSLNKSYAVSTTNTGTVTSAKALSELNDYNNEAKKILETNVIPAGETITFALNIWIDENVDTSIVGQVVSLKLDVVGTVYEQETASQTLMASIGDNGLSEIMNETNKKAKSIDSKEYRYTGSSPKNYIRFNCTDESNVETCETWRILGIYNNEKNGEVESRIKLIKDSNNLYLPWDSNGGTDYNASTLNAYLNGTYYESLNATAKNQIEDATYHLGGANALNINSKELYSNEMSSEEVNISKVGIMNLSDYTFGSGMDSQALIENIASKNQMNWLYKKSNEWMINKNSNGEIYSISEDGSISSGVVSEEKLIRPVVYLATNIKIVGGDGSETNPYILSK